ncbi:unnamed protein product [Arctia plantaginis]|uniref:Uncharacterized protein n=1 Tax=Arctia plantaginis TaxID=874455 RepID=A0A8S0ZRI8_ARCPL|nr:unnamed protein product [Arctia plantaginis]
MLSNGIPCVKPLVVSHDGSWPDVDYIWNNYPDVSCILADTDVCAQYTFYFNGQVENSTYFCTRAVDQFGTAITSGCHQQVNGSSITEICLCRSLPGQPPCNNSFLPSINFLTIAVTAMVFLIQFVVNNA